MTTPQQLVRTQLLDDLNAPVLPLSYKNGNWAADGFRLTPKVGIQKGVWNSVAIRKVDDPLNHGFAQKVDQTC